MKDKNKKQLYKCPECGFWYEEKKWRDKCAKWCRKNNSCNLDIIKHGSLRA